MSKESHWTLGSLPGSMLEMLSDMDFALLGNIHYIPLHVLHVLLLKPRAASSGCHKTN